MVRGARASELLLHFGEDRAVAERITDAEQGEPFGDLVVVEEALIRLINAALEDLAGAGAAGAGAAGVGQIDALLLGRIQDVGVIRTAETAAALKSDAVSGHGKSSEHPPVRSPRRTWLSPARPASAEGHPQQRQP